MKLTVLISLLTVSTALSAEVDVYLLGGQSNMQGLGKVNELTEEQKRLPGNLYLWNNNNFEPMEVGKSKLSARSGEFGPELAFAQSITDGKNPVFIIKYAASGMPLHHGWHVNKWKGGEPAVGRINFYPGKKATDVNKGKHYNQMSARFVAGIEALKKQGHQPVVRGFVWMQGEQDSKHQVSATSYAANLKLLKRRVAEDTNAEDLAMAFGQVLPYEKPLARFIHRNEIRQQMEAADMASGMPEAIFKTRMVSTNGFTLRKDTVHYDTEGQLRLGKALASGLQQAKTSGNKVYLYSNQQVPQFPKEFKHKKVFQKDPNRITNTSNPYMRVYLADPKHNTGKALLIFPGGGYAILADKKEGDSVAAYYSSQGINCFVVNYRVRESNKDRAGYMFPGPLLDARKAIRMVRANSAKWGIKTDKVGVMGFSAGGHLAGVTTTCYKDVLEGDEQSNISAKPDFSCLIYPVVSFIEPYSHAGSRYKIAGGKPSKQLLTQLSPEKRITKEVGPMFLLGNQWDNVKAENILHLALNAKKAGVQCELHMFSGKDHGFSMGRVGQTDKTNPAIAWPSLCLKFIQRQ